MTNALEFVTGSTPKMKARDAFNSWQNGIVIITIAGIVALRQVSAFGMYSLTSVYFHDLPTPTQASQRLKFGVPKDNQLWTKGKALQINFCCSFITFNELNIDGMSTLEDVTTY